MQLMSCVKIVRYVVLEPRLVREAFCYVNQLFPARREWNTDAKDGDCLFPFFHMMPEINSFPSKKRVGLDLLNIYIVIR